MPSGVAIFVRFLRSPRGARLPGPIKMSYAAPAQGLAARYRVESNTWCPRLTAAIIWFGNLGPVEGARIGVGLGEEAIDSGLKLEDGTEHAALQPSPGQLGEVSLDRIEPGGGG